MRPRPDRILEYREYPVLYVDDEPENLRIFELTFRRELSVLCARSGEEGLALIQAHPIALVLSDHRMPGMTGVEFLARASEMDPRTVRMLVTAYGDAETLGHAINSGTIYRFVPKPWTPDEMRLTLRRGIEIYALDREREQLLRELMLLNRVAKSMTQELELDPLIELLLDTVVEDLRYDAAAMLFLDPQQERLVWERFSPSDEVAAALRGLELSRETAPSFFGRVCNGEVQMLSLERALSLEGVLRRWVTEVAAEQILVVPLVGRRQTLGVLAADNRRGGKRFTADDQTLLEGLATQASIALENARLVEELRRSRDQLRRSERLGALGAGFASRLAHELANPLVAIDTFLQLAPAKRGEPDAGFWGGSRDLACRELERIRGLVAALQRLEPAPGAAAARAALEPRELVEEVARQERPLAEERGVDLRVEAAAPLPKLFAARDELREVVGQLLRNAIQASRAGDEVSLRVAADPASGELCLEVTDTGDGIPEEILARIFDPLFSTGGAGRGAGLGLPLCQRIVSEHGGSIELRSRVGEGTSVCVRLPTASHAGRSPGAASLDPPAGDC